jgi:hypothetical protein
MARVDQVLYSINRTDFLKKYIENYKKYINKLFYFPFVDAFLIMAKQPSQKRTGSSSGLFSSLPGHNKKICTITVRYRVPEAINPIHIFEFIVP